MMASPTMQQLDALTTSSSVRGAVDSLLLYCRHNHVLSQLLKRVMVGSDNVDEYMAALQNGSDSSVCAYVFKPREAAYQCRTCGVDPTCIQCMKCFRNANHDGHDIIMTHAGGGGCCDCGDASSWSPEGFCKDHKGHCANDQEATPLPPRAQWVVTEVLRVVCCALLQEANCNYVVDSAHDPDIVEASDSLYVLYLLNDDVNSFVSVVSCLNELGLTNDDSEAVALRAHNAGQALLFASSATRCDSAVEALDSANLHSTLYAFEANSIILSESRVETLLLFLAELCRTSSTCRDVICADICLQRVMDAWRIESTVRTNATRVAPSESLPESTRSSETSLLSMLLPATFSMSAKINAALSQLNFQLFVDPAFKQTFALEFTSQYGTLLNISETNSSDVDSVLDYSVQLFTIPDMVLRLARDHGLVDSLLDTLLALLQPHVNSHGVLEARADMALEQKLTHVFKDLHFILSNNGVPEMILKERPQVLHNWCRTLRLLESLDSQTRCKDVHVEYESQSWLFAFRLCLRANTFTSIVLNCFERLMSQATHQEYASSSFWARHLIRSLLDRTINEIVVPGVWHWTEDNVALPEAVVDTDPVSFHYPLRRMVLRMAVSFCRHTDEDLRSMFEDVPVPLMFFEGNTEACYEVEKESFVAVHPILLLADPCVQLLAAVSHMQAGLWVLNGSAVSHQVHNYRRVGVREGLLDADLEALQAAATVLGGQSIVQLLTYRMLLHDWFQPGLTKPAPTLRWSTWSDEKVVLAAEHLLRLMILMLSSRTRFAQHDPKWCLRRQVLHWLMTGDLTYSAILEKIDEESASVEGVSLAVVLDEVATFIQPRGMESGRFRLRPELVKEFDPFFSKYSVEEKSLAEQTFLSPPGIGGTGRTDMLFPPTPVFRPFLRCFARLWDVLSAPATRTIVLSTFRNIERSSSRLLLCCCRLLQIGIADCSASHVSSVQRASFIASVTSSDDDADNGASVIGALCHLIKSDEAMLRPHITLARNLVTELARMDRHCHHIASLFGLQPKPMASCDHTVMDQQESLSYPEDVAEAARKMARTARRQKAKERALQRIEEQKRRFTSANRVALEQLDAPAVSGGDTDPAQLEVQKCILCRSNDEQNEMGVLGWIGKSRVPDQLTQPLTLRCAEAPMSLRWSIVAKSCGHSMHASCLDRHERTLRDHVRFGQRYEGQFVVDVSAREVVCPFCKCSANALIPTFPEPSSSSDTMTLASEICSTLLTSDSHDDSMSVDDCTDLNWLRTVAGNVGSGVVCCLRRLRDVPPLVRSFRADAIQIMDSRVMGRIYCTSSFSPSSPMKIDVAYLARMLTDTVISIEVGSRLASSSVCSDFDCKVLNQCGIRQLTFVGMLLRSACGMILCAAPEDEIAQQMEELGFCGLSLRGFEGRNDIAMRRLLELDLIEVLLESVLALWLSLSSTIPSANGDPSVSTASLNILVALPPEALAILHRAVVVVVRIAVVRACADQPGKVCTRILPVLRQVALVWYAAAGGARTSGRVDADSSDETDEDEVDKLLKFLGLPDVLNDDDADGFSALLKSAMDTTQDGLLPLVKPRLVDLPHRYDDLFQYAADTKCKRCSSNPMSPALCLVCGELLCASGACCSSDSQAELSQHTMQHCGLQGAFLVINESGVLFLFDGFDMHFSSPYLDAHGEEDLGLRRGKPLFLDTERWNTVQRIYANHEVGSYVSRHRSYTYRLYQRNAF